MGVWSNMQYLAGNHTIERIGFYITVLYSSWVIEFRRISAWLWLMLQGGKDVYEFLSSSPHFDNRSGNEGDDFNSGFSVLSECRNVAGCRNGVR